MKRIQRDTSIEVSRCFFICITNCFASKAPSGREPAPQVIGGDCVQFCCVAASKWQRALSGTPYVTREARANHSRLWARSPQKRGYSIIFWHPRFRFDIHDGGRLKKWNFDGGEGERTVFCFLGSKVTPSGEKADVLPHLLYNNGENGDFWLLFWGFRHLRKNG